ncbi:MAG: DUF4157 domain-containing protein [Kofleriaceae bacterium]
MSRRQRSGDGQGGDEEVQQAPAIGPGKRSGTAAAKGGPPPAYPGKRTLTQHFAPRANRVPPAAQPQRELVESAFSGPSREIPHRQEMERGFGQSFSDVRAFFDEAAATAAEELGARAFAVGDRIAFADDDPDKQLVAHELAHVVQQRGGTPIDTPQFKLATTEPGDAAEREADDASATVLAGGVATVGKHDAAIARDTRERGPATHVRQFAGLPGPILLEVAGDKLEVELMILDHVPWVRVQYLGPDRVTVDGSTARFAKVELLPVHLRGNADYHWTRPLEAVVRGHIRDGVSFDLYGDGSAILDVLSQTDTSTLDVRAHVIRTNINRQWAGMRMPRIEIHPKAAVKGGTAAATRPDSDGEKAVVIPLILNGDHFELGARRFGTTNQMLLSLKNDRRSSEVLVPVAGDFKNPGLRILRNDGRNISIDLDNDGVDDATLIHTMRQYRHFDRRAPHRIDTFVEQEHDHRLTVYDSQAVRAGELFGIATAGKIVVPPELDPATNPAPDGQPQPADRAPVQDDVPAEQALAVKHQSRDWEIRFDGNGDRTKELLMRVVPTTPQVEGKPRTYKVNLTQLETHQTAEGMEITLTAEQAKWFDEHGPRQTVATDGIAATEIAFVAEGATPLHMELRPWPGDNPWFQATMRETKQTHPFFISATRPTGSLTDPEKPATSKTLAKIKALEMELGEYGDKFRFTVEETPKSTFAVILGVTAVGPGSAVAGVGYHLGGRNSVYLERTSVSANYIGFDTTGSGETDLMIFDAMSAPMDEHADQADRLKMPERDRDHRIRITDKMQGQGRHASQIPPEPFTFRIRDGKLISSYDKGPTQRYAAGAGQSIGILEEQGERTSMLDTRVQLDSSMLAAAGQILALPEHAAHGPEVSRAWLQLYNDMMFIDGQMGGAQGVDPKRVESAQDCTRIVFTWLRSITASASLAVSFTTANPVTGEKVTKSSGHAPRIIEPAYGTRLLGDLGAGKYSEALVSYEAMSGGFYTWVSQQLAKQHGASSAEVKQFEYMRESQQQVKEIGKNATAFRVPATFIADESYQKEQDYNTYRTVAMQVYVWKEGKTWYVRDLTNSGTKPFKGEAEASEYEGDRPPRALFETLNHKRAYPKGVIRYHLPDAENRDGTAAQDGGHGDSIVCDEHKTWADHLSDLALALAVVGLIAATGGLGLVATAAFAASAIAGAAGSVAEIADAYEHGYEDGKLVFVNIVNIVANLASLGMLTAGKTVTSAALAAREGQAWTGGAARMVQFARAAYVPLAGASVVANGVQLLVMGHDVLEQLAEIDRTVPEDKRAAMKARVLAQFALMGGLTIMSIKGDLPEVFGKSPIVIDVVNGVRVARAAGVEIGGARVKLDDADAHTQAGARWHAQELQEAALERSPRGEAARRIMEDKKYREGFASWMGQADKVNANGKVIPPSGASTELIAELQRFADGGKLAMHENAFEVAKAIETVRAKGAGLDMNPTAPTWPTTRNQLIEILGGGDKAKRIVATFEAATQGAKAKDLGAFLGQRASITRFLPESEIDSLRRFYPESEVYLAGDLAKPGAVVDPNMTHIEVVVVAPPNTPAEMLDAMEQRLAGHEIHPDSAFLADHPHASKTVRAKVKVVTADQFLGLSASGAGAVHKLDSSMPEMISGGSVRSVGKNHFIADAGDLHGVHDTWKNRGGNEKVSDLHYDPVTHQSHFDIEVGKGGSKQRIRVSAEIAPRITSSVELVANTNRVVGKPVKSLAAGHAMLRDLNQGKLGELGKIGVDVPAGTTLPEGTEFGLGRAGDHYVVVRGGVAEVDWERLPGIEPVAHTHPSTKGNDLTDEIPSQRPDRFEPGTGERRTSIADLTAVTPDPLLDRELVFASAPDISLMARRKINDHRVVTPFVVRDGHVLKAKPGDTAHRLEWVIRKPEHVGSRGTDVIYKAELVGEVNGKPVEGLTKEVWATQGPDGTGNLFMVEPAGMIARPPEAPAPVGSQRTAAIVREQIQAPSGAMVEVVSQGTVIVPTGKVEGYLRGAVIPFTPELKQELAALQLQKQTARKVFDANPANEARIERLKDLKHNFERSQDMAATLADAGIDNTLENNTKLMEHLLEVGKTVTPANRVKVPSTVVGDKGNVMLQSTWTVLPDGRAYLSTVIVMPKTKP